MRAHRVVLGLSLLFILGGAAVDGCGGTTPPALGLEGAGCYSDGSCNSQLVCVAKLCRRPAAGSTAGAGGGTAGAGGAGGADGGVAGADAGPDATIDVAAAIDVATTADAGPDGAAGIDGAATEVGNDAAAIEVSGEGGGGSDAAADAVPAFEAGADANDGGLEVGGDGGDI